MTETFFFFNMLISYWEIPFVKSLLQLLAYFHVRFVFFIDLQNIYCIHFPCAYDFRRHGDQNSKFQFPLVVDLI